MSIFDRLYGSTKEEIFAREVAKNMDEVKLTCPNCKDVQLVRDSKTGKYICARCKKSFGVTPDKEK